MATTRIKKRVAPKETTSRVTRKTTKTVIRPTEEEKREVRELERQRDILNKKGVLDKKGMGGYALPKAFWGAALQAVPAVTSLLGTIIGGGKQKREAEEAARQAKALADATNMATDEESLKDFQPEGFGSVNYYQAHGGKLAKIPYTATGGDLMPLSSDSVMADGNKHGETTIDNTSGIKLSQGNNKPFVEIEDKEVITDNKVYSARLRARTGKTFAEEAEKLARIKKRTEKNSTGTLISRNTTKRTLANLDKAEEDLFNEQEMMKEEKGLSNPATTKAIWGANFEDIVNTVTPFIDNIGNAIINANTPKIPKPFISPTPRYRTKVNVNPQLGAVTKGVESASRFVENNTANSNTARNAITALRLKGADSKSGILANKENVEANLHNAAVDKTSQVNAANLAKVDNYNMLNFQRSNEIQGRTSANLANLADDFTSARNYKAAERYNKERLDIAKQMYNQETTRRALLGNESELRYLKDNPEYANEVLKMFKGTAEEPELMRILGFN